MEPQKSDEQVNQTQTAAQPATQPATQPVIDRVDTPQQPPTANPFSTPPEESRVAAETGLNPPPEPKPEPQQPEPTPEEDQKVGIFKRLAQTLFGTEEVSEEAVKRAEEIKARAERDIEIERRIQEDEQAKLAQDANYQREQYLADVYRQVYEQTQDPYQAQARVDLVRQQMFTREMEGVIQQRIDAALHARNAQAGLASRRPELAPLSNVIADLGATYGSRLPEHMRPRTPEEQIELGERFVMELVKTVTGQNPQQTQAQARPAPATNPAWARAQVETGGGSPGMETSENDIEKQAVEMARALFGSGF